VTKVNVEQMTVLLEHNVVIVTIANAEDIRGDTVTRARRCELQTKQEGQDEERKKTEE